MSKLAIGPLRPNGVGSHYFPERVKLDVPQRITNSSSRQPYVPPSWNVRAGADDHQQIKSRGIDA